MKNIILALVLFFVLLFAYVKLTGPIPFSVNSVTTQKTDTFNVTGEGKATVVPDIAMVTVGVQTNGPTVKGVQQQLNTAINNVSAAVKKLGVDPKDIKTTNYSIYPNYDYRNGQQHITGYSASSNLAVKVRDLDKVNDVIDAATASGANQVSGVSFEVEDKTKAENEARKLAVAEAKHKAQQAAQAAGFSLGRIINYSENLNGTPRPVPLYAQAEAVGGGTPTQVEPGSTEIQLEVTLSFEIK